ncbi:MAG: 50S ribosomal protein L22 [Candidatus Pacearchaeota archaeon]
MGHRESEQQEARRSSQLNKMVEEKTIEQIKKPEEKVEKKSEVKQQGKEKIAKVYLKDVPISTKYAVEICRFIKGKNPEEAINFFRKVLKKKEAVPMRGEFPHRKNMPKGTPQGKYPLIASKIFIKALKNLIANAKVKLLDTEKIYICTAKADKASRPIKATRIAFGVKRFKRSHVLLEAKEKENIKSKKLEEKKEEKIK